MIDKLPVHFAGELVDTIRDAARRCGYASMDMLNGAGHDAMNVARVAPTGMIFVQRTAAGSAFTALLARPTARRVS